VLLFVGVEEDWLLPPVVPTSLESEPAATIDPLVVEVADALEVFDTLEVADALEVGNKLEGSVTLAHERSYNGVVPKSLSLVVPPRRPKLGTGVVGAASCRTYHQVLTLSNADAHPT